MQQVKDTGALQPSHASVPGRLRRDADGVSVSGMMSMLSLFLLLLAFFIMLNSLAQFEAQRTRAAIDSLNSTFSAEDSEKPTHIFGSYVGSPNAIDDLQKEITGLLRTLLGFDRFEVVRDGPLLSAIIDADALFENDVSGTPLLNDLSKRMAEILNNASNVALRDVSVYARLPRITAASESETDIGAIRAGGIVRSFARAGVAESILASALEPGNPKRIRLQFRVVEERASQ